MKIRLENLYVSINYNEHTVKLIYIMYIVYICNCPSHNLSHKNRLFNFDAHTMHVYANTYALQKNSL